jgi:hypothetical protein
MLLVAVVALANIARLAPPVCLRPGDAGAIALVVVTRVPDYPERVPPVGPSRLEGLAGARVVVRMGGKILVNKSTDATGLACLVVPAGEHTIGVTAPGFKGSVLHRIKVDAGAQVERTMELVRGKLRPPRSRPDQGSNQ